MRQHAERLATVGFRVLPLHYPIFGTSGATCSCGNDDCKSVGKHPLNANGSTGASSDLAQIAQWWKQWPNANIGIATGHLVDVVDVDGPAGSDLFADYVARFGHPQYWASAETGRAEGGGHYYCTPGGLQGWTGGSGGHPTGLDCKGIGGYVVAPPSRHETGKFYTWTLDPFGSGEALGETSWPEWHSAVNRDVKRVALPAETNTGELVIRQPRGVSGHGFAETVCQRVRDEVSVAGEGSRWQTLAMTGMWGMAGLVLGGEIGRADALHILTELARELGLGNQEIGRLPAELERALTKRTIPIQSNGTRAALNGSRAAPATPSPVEAGSGSPDGLGADYEAAEIDRRAGLYWVEILARRQAQERVRREEAGERTFIDPVDLDALLKRPIEIVQYRISDLWPINSRALLSAQFKAGKTTMVGNVVRSLADNSRFLSRYQATQPDGTIGLFDTEMSESMLQSWLRDQAIAQTGKVWLASLRGACAGFDLSDDLIRAHWARVLQDRGTDIVVLDCLSPVLAAMGLDESATADMGKFISAFEALLHEAHVKESLVVHHMGHSGERSRGSSRLRDWPDVEWHLIREGQEDERAPSPNVPRYFRAYGRDVNLPEQLLSYDETFRWLSVEGGNRRENRTEKMRAQILDIVKNEPGINGRGIRAAMTGRTEGVADAIKAAIKDGLISTAVGPRSAVFHYVVENQP